MLGRRTDDAAEGSITIEADSTLSSRHCGFYYSHATSSVAAEATPGWGGGGHNAEPGWLIEDLGSRNGSSVDSPPDSIYGLREPTDLAAGQAFRLCTGAVVRLGAVELSVNVIDSKSMALRAALAQAVQASQTDKVEALLSTDPSADVNGYTIGSVGDARAQLVRQADRTLPVWFPLHLAVLTGDPGLEMAQTLIRAGARVNTAAGPLRRTPLHLAAARSHLAAVELLLAHGADLELTDRNGLAYVPVIIHP